MRELRTGFGPPSPPPLLMSLEQEVIEVGRSAPSAPGRLEITTANVASLAVDTGAGTSGACLGAGPVEFSITTDGPFTLRLTDGRMLRISEAGTHAGTLASVAELAGAGGPVGADDAADRSLSSLPATGRSSEVVLVPLMMLVGLAMRRLTRRGAAGRHFSRGGEGGGRR